MADMEPGNLTSIPHIGTSHEGPAQYIRYSQAVRENMDLCLQPKGELQKNMRFFNKNQSIFYYHYLGIDVRFWNIPSI